MYAFLIIRGNWDPFTFRHFSKSIYLVSSSTGNQKQMNFLIIEDETIGPDGTKVHGPDSVISMLDWALENHNSGEMSCTIHTDNCCGQNKNQYVIGYFMWRVMTKQHNRIEFKMQIPGHARCLIDKDLLFSKSCTGGVIVKPLSNLKMFVTYLLLQTLCAISSVAMKILERVSWAVVQTSEGYSPVPTLFGLIPTYEPGIVTAKKTCDETEEKVEILKD